MATLEFKLTAQLAGHSNDVRAVLFPRPDTIFSASRDATVRVRRRQAGDPTAFDDNVWATDDAYINTLALIPSPGQGASELVAWAGHSAQIHARQLDPQHGPASDMVRLGHLQNVCAIDGAPNGKWMVSASWDGSCLVWTTKPDDAPGLIHRELVHASSDAATKTPVWGAVAWDNSTVVTGSADQNMRIFDLRKATPGAAGRVYPVATRHTGTLVRALHRLSPEAAGDIASAGNDFVIRTWRLDLARPDLVLLAELRGHTSFIYSIDNLPGGEIVSASEDRTVRIWRDHQCVQTITHPAISVWSVAVCHQNGDIATGASDNMVRVFSRSPDRQAPADALEQFHQMIAASAIPAADVKVERETLQGPDVLKAAKGKKDGEVKMVKEPDGSVSVHQWSQAAQSWAMIGSLADTPGSDKKIDFEGKPYDFVFDVDIQEGKPHLKLPYNAAENPYDAATRFLNNNELPISYLETVVNFIRENSQAHSIGHESSSAIPPEASRPSPSPAAFLPHLEFILMDQIRLEPIVKKLTEFNSTLVGQGKQDISLSADQISGFASLKDKMLNKPKQGLEHGSPELLAQQREWATSAASSWPYSLRLPALDLLRFMALSPGGTVVETASFGNVVNLVARAALDVQSPVSESGSLSEFIEANALPHAAQVDANKVMMTMRAVANIFASSQGQKVALKEADGVLALMGFIVGLQQGVGPLGTGNNNLQLALASAAFNYSCLAYHQSQGATVDLRHLEEVELVRLVEVLGCIMHLQSDAEVLFRALMALGMVLLTKQLDSDRLKAVVARKTNVKECVVIAKSKSSDRRVRGAADECLALLG